jgi:hypothetical protein
MDTAEGDALTKAWTLVTERRTLYPVLYIS